MKKILSIGLILVLMLIMFGCKSKPIADDEEVYVESVGNEGENETEPEPEQQTDPEQHSEPKQDEQQSPEQQEVQQPEQNEEQQPTQQTEPVEENDTTQPETEQTEQNEELEKAPPCQATIEDDFDDDKIDVAFIREESRKQKQYTAEDFPELDIKEIKIEVSYNPKIDNIVVLRIVLNSHDKQKVLDGIRILEGYDIVYSAEPNYYGTILQTNNDSSYISLEQMENIISAISPTPRYTSTDAMSEYNANLSTLACCAKKYTTAGINKTTAIGFVGDWCL